jgi:hypothetical protein
MFHQRPSVVLEKRCEVLSTMECPWLCRLIMRQNGKFHFPIPKQLVKDHILFMLAKTMDRYVFPTLAQCDTAIVTFDLWMSQMSFDIFALVVNFLNREWVPCHVTIGLFKAPNICGVALAQIVKPFLAKFKLTNKVITCVKYEGKNLATLNSSLLNVVSLGCLSWTDHIQGCVLDI